MKRKYTTNLSPDECRNIIRECVDFFSFNFGYEQFMGWVKFNMFSISYRSGNVRMYNPIFNKVIGKLKHRGGKTIVEFKTYKGLTDFFSVTYIFIASLIIIHFASRGELDIWTLLGLSALCSILAATITFAFTWITTEGEEGEERLFEFLLRNLELKEIK